MTFYLSFNFFRIDSKWRWMADLAKQESAKEAEAVLAGSGARTRVYSTLGLRGEADALFWFGAPDTDGVQRAVSRLYTTVLGKYLLPARTYLSCTRPSAYAPPGKALPFEEGREPKKYAVVYPFTKSREWYLLPRAERQQMMDEHIAVGRRHPGVDLNTTYSFGLDDQDFMLAFETDDLADFQDLIMELRETRVSRYVVQDTPMMPCASTDVQALVSSLG